MTLKEVLINLFMEPTPRLHITSMVMYWINSFIAYLYTPFVLGNIITNMGIDPSPEWTPVLFGYGANLLFVLLVWIVVTIVIDVAKYMIAWKQRRSSTP